MLKLTLIMNDEDGSSNTVFKLKDTAEVKKNINNKIKINRL